MKNVYLIAVTLLLFIFKVQSQENFGGQFKDWVLKDAARDSRALSISDYRDRLPHTINLIDELIIRNLQKSDSIMAGVYNQIQKDEKEIVDMDSIPATLHRLKSSRLAYYQLLEAENFLHISSKLKTNLDSLDSKAYFYYMGLYHVGRETLLESYASIGNQFADNFQLKYQNNYTIGFTATFNENGEATSASGQTGISGTYTVIGTNVGAGVGAVIGGAAGGIGAVPGAVLGGVIGGAVGGTVDYFTGRKKAKEQQKKAEKEFKKQMRLLEEGLTELPKQLAPVDTLFVYYKDCVLKSLISNKDVQESINNSINIQTARFKEIFSYNVRRQQLSQQKMTTHNIELIERSFMSVGALRSFYSNLGKINFIKDCNQMFARLSAEEHWLKTANVNRFDWLQHKEAYEDDLRFALLLLQQFLNNETYIPYQKYLLEKKKTLDSMVNNLPQHPNLIVVVPVLGRMKSMNANRGQKDNIAKQMNESTHIIIPHNLLPVYNSAKDVNVGICFGAGGYSLCSGINSNSYNARFNNNGQSPVTDILGSSQDGGLSSFGAVATRQIGAMRVNIQDRITALNSDYSSLEKVIPSARRTYTQQLGNMVESARHLGTLSSEEIGHFNVEFDTKMPVLKIRLEQYMNQPLRTGLANLQKDLDMTIQIRNQIKPADMPVSVFRIGNIDFGYENNNGGQGLGLAMEREVAKQTKSLRDIEKRVADNRDPVFRSERGFKDFKNTLGQINQLLANISYNEYYGFEEQSEITAHYLKQAIKMRYAASGQLPADDLAPIDFAFQGNAQINRLDDIVKDFKNCDPDQDDCSSAYGNAIYQLYNNNSIIGLSNAEGQSFNGANIKQLVSTSSNWQPIGQANSMSVVNEAAMLAMSGSVVIATQSVDMNVKVGIVVPALPKLETSGKWKDTPVLEIFYLDEVHPSNSFSRSSISTNFSDPSEVTFYTKLRPQSFNNVDITIQDKGIKAFPYNDPVNGDIAKVPSLNFTIHTTSSGRIKSSEQTIPVAGDYVERITKQYGSNSRKVFENIYEHRDELYGSYPKDLAGLTAAENVKLNRLGISVSRFEDRERLMHNPADLYYCQTSRCLYNSCISELRRADPLDRDKILDYYNQVEDALVKYHDDALNIGTMITPGVNDARDLYEFVTGKDLITGGILSIWERGLSGAGIFVGSGAFYREIGNLPFIRQNALEIARLGIPDFTMIKSGDLKYYFKSKGGIYYERWNGSINNDRFSKIVQSHFIDKKNTYFIVDNQTSIPALLDEAWKLAKDRGVKPLPAHGGNVKYIVDMGRPVGNSGRQFITLVFDETKGSGFIVTAFPHHLKH